MGTPEFPDLGKHCSVDYCKQIDFLPFTCDRCDKVFCLEHRSFGKHQCPNANKFDVTVVICPLCAKGVRLIPDEDANITWEKHVNTDCDPSNYVKATKKKKCPVTGCRELLTFSNTIKCRDCTIDHCLKHRFGPDHKCPGPKKPNPTSFPFLNLLSKSQKVKSKSNSSSSPTWTTSFLNAASSVKASAEASMEKLSKIARDGMGPSSSGSGGTGQVEECPQCRDKFYSVESLVEHVQKVHERGNNRNGGKKTTIDACPKCSKGFVDPVALVEHVEKEHGGSSKAYVIID
ncbi:Zinc finger AN1 and C2H2 domain-containing stress-associated protein 16 [Ranunculus cassubicifolius]